MARYSKPNQVSPETQEEAMRIAKGIQRPGQTKEQTKLIAQGIQKGIDQYKKQYKAKVRELDKRSKRLVSKSTNDEETDTAAEVIVEYRQSPLPWILLVISWIGFIGYLIYGKGIW